MTVALIVGQFGDGGGGAWVTRGEAAAADASAVESSIVIAENVPLRARGRKKSFLLPPARKPLDDPSRSKNRHIERLL